MKKWYKSAFCKGILIFAAQAAAVAVAICLVIGLAYPGQNYEDFFTRKASKKYEDTKGFADEVADEFADIAAFLNSEDILLKNGALDLSQLVDVNYFYEYNEITDKPGEFSLSIQELLDLPADIGANGEEILVAETAQGDWKYHYYTYKQFLQESKENGYIFSNEISDGVAQEDVLAWMEDGSWLPSGEIQDSEGNKIYKEIWSLGRYLNMDCRMANGKNLLEIANESADWNGKLADMIDRLEAVKAQMDGVYETYLDSSSYYVEGNTNLSYLIVDHDQNILKTNRAEYQDISRVDASIEDMMKDGKYLVIAPTLAGCMTNISEESRTLAEWREWSNAVYPTFSNYKLVISVDTEYPIQDSFYIWNQAYEKYMPWMRQAITIGGISILVFLISVVWLTAVASRSNYREGTALVFYDKWKTEIWFAAMAALVIMVISLSLSWLDWRLDIDWDPWYYGISRSGKVATSIIVGVGVIAFALCSTFFIAYLSLVRRIKARNLWKNSILRWLLQTVNYIYQNRSCITKSIILGGGLLLVNLLLLSGFGFFGLIAIAADIYVIIRIAKLGIEKEKIKQGISKIASGDSEYKIPLEKLTGDNRDIAEQVNHIGEGIQNAVEKSLKDERLKTDLITNVSHDIKTPLTSIINYVGLLKQEKFEDPKIQRYLDILDEKSQRLKTLTEDVVEASKISSGNISLEFINLNLVELIHQTTGEFAEKFEKKDLKAVLSLPESPAIVRVDGRRMWRVIENIYNNAAKYAMPGTRIYADMVANGRTVVFSLKNVSEHPLNITADELTERFIRGDVSRSTEGSGLGLSIAKNLTEMQGGEFRIYVDGDLFKVTITFPQMAPSAPQEDGEL